MYEICIFCAYDFVVIVVCGRLGLLWDIFLDCLRELDCGGVDLVCANYICCLFWRTMFFDLLLIIIMRAWHVVFVVLIFGYVDFWVMY